MPWPTRYHPTEPETLQVGDVYPFPVDSAHCSRQYLERNSGRPPLIVVLPCGTRFLVDRALRDGDGWDVSGPPERLTVSPSISVLTRSDAQRPDERGWHGYLRDGVLTDDVDGRRF